MTHLAAATLELRALDDLARGDSPIHRLDPRAKILATGAFLIAVMSMGRYEIAALMPFFLYPLAIIAMGGIPTAPILRRLLLASPFVLCLGIFNPLLDREPLLQFGGLAISGGWISYLSIILRFLLTAGAALALIAVTGMDRVCLALGRLGVPAALVTQLLFLYRYLHTLLEEAAQMSLARELRAPGNQRLPLRQFGQLLAALFLRTWDRARRIHEAMTARGFTGEMRLLARLQLRVADFLFLGGWIVFFACARFFSLPGMLGALVTGVR